MSAAESWALVITLGAACVLAMFLVDGAIDRAERWLARRLEAVDRAEQARRDALVAALTTPGTVSTPVRRAGGPPS